MRKTNLKIQVPFREDDSMLISYKAYMYRNNTYIVWKDNYVFEDVMTVYKIWKTGSRTYVELRNRKGLSFYMFLTDFEEMIVNDNVMIVNGTLRTNWTFVKHGEYYGIKVYVE